MNDVLNRIAELRARFEPAPPTTTVAAGSADFSKLLASAQSSSASGGAGSSTGNGVTDLSSVFRSLTGSTGVDTTSLASLSRLLQQSKSATATSGIAATSAARGAGTAGAIPAGYAEYAATISQVATDEGVPASLLAALVWSESSFHPDAVSSAGARGLTQLMPATAAGLDVDIDNPTDNLRGGARYLRQMLDRFGSPELALAAYNAGPGAVTRANGIPDYPEPRTT